jgi:rod shape-determining protein MreD
VKWIPFCILAAVAIILQTNSHLLPRLLPRATPDLMFLLAVYYALWGPSPHAAIAAWGLGLLLGMHTLDGIGPHALAYGAAAWCILKLRSGIYRDHPLAHFAITLVFALGVQICIGLYRWWKLGGLSGAEFWPLLLAAVYTAALAPPVFWLLDHLAPWTGLRHPRRSGSYR